MRLVEANTENIMLAAAAIRRGELVGMPTETVYGIACDALDPQAVHRVYELKERPSDNPLIIHIATLDDIDRVVASWPKMAADLAERFWPGPLTLVLPRAETIPPEATAGLDTVAVRMPSHPVAGSLIRQARTPIAAPSANRFMRLSPTKSEDIDPAIAEGLSMVLEGGASTVGLESTVLDVSGDRPRILRPGGVSRGAIQAVLREPLAEAPPNGAKRSPGMYPRHYAPKATVVVVDEVKVDEAGIVFAEPQNPRQIRLPADAGVYGAHLYAALHKLDGAGVEMVRIQRPPQDAAWEAVNDRLAKMCT